MIKTIRLLPEDIVQNWNLIKYGTTSASGVEDKLVPQYCVGLLQNLFNNDCQCWFILSHERKIKVVILTKIVKDSGNIVRFLIDTLYGYLATTKEEQEEAMDTFMTFAKNTGCTSIIANSANEMVWKIMEKMQMIERFRSYERRIA